MTPPPFPQAALRVLTLGAAVTLPLACGGEPTDPGDGGGATVHDVDLAVGEAATYPADGQVLKLRLPSASSGREYRLAAQSAAAGTPDQLIPMRLTRGDGSSGSGSISGSRRAAGPGTVPPWAEDLLIRQRIRSDSRRRLVRGGVRPARPSDGTSGGDVRTSTMLPTGSPPQEGDTLQFWFAARDDFSTTCNTTEAEEVTAVVEDADGRAAIVQDTAAPEGTITQGGFTSMDFQEIGATFDTLVVPVDSAYFGSPTDIDGNERVFILFTPKVNELDPDTGDTQVGGFFIPQDLSDSGDPDKDGAGSICAASNESELLYIRAPDPGGQFSDNATTADEARRNAFSVSSHELQHLLNAANRVIKNQNGGFGDLETTWLSEGLSHVAEEVVGLAALDVPVRSNLIYDETAGSDSQTFQTYLINDFFNAGRFMESSPTARSLATEDPQGQESLQMRGFGWLFVRWVTDHHASASAGAVPGSGEETLIRDLAQADGNELSTGVDNVEGVTGAAFGGLLADFGLTLSVDDDVDGAGGAQVLPTWHLRDMYSGLAANSSTFQNEFGQYPLDPVETGFTAGTTDFEVRPGAGKHFILSSSGSTPELQVELTDQTGNALATGTRARIVIYRAR